MTKEIKPQRWVIVSGEQQVWVNDKGPNGKTAYVREWKKLGQQIGIVTKIVDGRADVDLVAEDGSTFATVATVAIDDLRIACIEEIPSARLPDTTVAERVGYQWKGEPAPRTPKSAAQVKLAPAITDAQNVAKNKAIEEASRNKIVLSDDDIAEIIKDVK